MARRETDPSLPSLADAALFARYGRVRDRSARDALVDRYWALAEGLARRYAGRGIDGEDLHQVALLGLVRALDRFDPARGVAFSSFAAPTILGELRRHFRDHGWMVHVPRRLQELRLQADEVRERLGQERGRTPTWAEIASACDASPDEVAMALDGLRSAYRADSLDQRSTGTVRAASEPVEDEVIRAVLVASLLSTVPERDRRILVLRFWEGRTQEQIAERVGLSQMHVSRRLRASLGRMRRALVSAGQEAAGPSFAAAARHVDR